MSEGMKTVIYGILQALLAAGAACPISFTCLAIPSRRPVSAPAPVPKQHRCHIDVA